MNSSAARDASLWESAEILSRSPTRLGVYHRLAHVISRVLIMSCCRCSISSSAGLALHPEHLVTLQGFPWLHELNFLLLRLNEYADLVPSLLRNLLLLRCLLLLLRRLARSLFPLSQCCRLSSVAAACRLSIAITSRLSPAACSTP